MQTLPPLPDGNCYQNNEMRSEEMKIHPCIDQNNEKEDKITVNKNGKKREHDK